MATPYETWKQQHPDAYGGGNTGSQSPVTQPSDLPASQPVSPTAPTAQDNLSKMANYDKISPFEKWVYGVLPKVANSGFGKVMKTFGESWAGKMLGYLDVPAEGVERSIGTVVQALDYANKNEGSFENFDWKNAWYAGSMFADTLNLPTISHDEQGHITGISVPTDSPGTSGMVEARQKLASGMSLADVKAQYYDSRGALALRGQLRDAVFHVVADPLNYILPALKPVEWLQAKSIIALTGKATEASILAEKGTIGAFIEAEKLAQTTAKAAVEAGGEATDIAKATERIAQATENIDNATSALRNVEKVRPITKMDNLAIWLSGGNPLEPNAFSKTAIGKIVTKPFQLTQESKIREAMDIFQNGIGSTLIEATYNTQNAEEDFFKGMMRISAQAYGPEYGAAIMSPIGQTVQALAKGSEVAAMGVMTEYRAIAGERTLIQSLSDILGESMESILKQSRADGSTVLQKLEQALTNGAVPSPFLASLLEKGEVTGESLNKLGYILEKVPYEKSQFFAEMLGKVSEQAMQQSLLKFGISGAKNLPQRWAAAAKTAETLAFIKINPANMVRNAINNEVTMMARGVFGVTPLAEIEAFYKAGGWIPERMAQGFGLSGEAEATMNAAEKLLGEALKGDAKYGIPEKIAGMFRKADLGVFDMSKISRRVESASSMQAYYQAHMTFLDNYAEYTKASKFFDKATIDLLEQESPGIVKNLENVVKSARGNNEAIDKVLGTSLHINVQSVLDDAGVSAEQFGPEIMTYLHNGLPEAMKSGKTEEFFVNLQNKIEGHIDDLYKSNLESHIDDIAHRAEMGGPNVWYQEIGDSIDRWHSTEIQHRLRISELAEAAHTEKDPGKLNSLWTKINSDESAYFARAEKFHEATLAGLKKGTAAIEAKWGKMPDVSELEKAFGEVRTGWKGFFAERNTAWSDFYKNAAGLDDVERNRLYDQITKQLDDSYVKMVESEDVAALRMDEVVSNAIDDPAKKQLFNNWRDSVADIRKTQRNGVVNMHKALSSARTPQARQDIYHKFMGEYAELEKKAANFDKMGHAMMQDDPLAKRLLEATGTTSTLRDAERQTIFAEKNSGTILNPKHEASIYKSYPDKAGNTFVIDLKGNFDPAKLKPGQILIQPDGMADKVRLEAEIAQLEQLNHESGGWGIFKAPDGTEGTVALQKKGDELLKVNEQIKHTTLTDLINKIPQQSRSEIMAARAMAEKGENVAKSAASKAVDMSKYERRAIDKLNSELHDAEKVNDREKIQELLGKIADEKAKTTAEMERRNPTAFRIIMNSEDKIKAAGIDIQAELESFAMSHTDIPSGKSATEFIGSLDKKILAKLQKVADGEGVDIRAVISNAIQDIKLKNGIEEPRMATMSTGKNISYVEDVDKLMEKPRPDFLGFDDISQQQYSALDKIKASAGARAEMKSAALQDLSPQMQDKVRSFVEEAKRGNGEVRFAANRYAEYGRDSALLNYNRKTNFDTWAGTVFPYSFWTTASIVKWAVHSIDRPAMLTTYLRTKKLLETAGAPETGFPSRMRDNIKIKLPFLPDWMGDQFINPMKLALPFDAFAQPFEQFSQNKITLNGRAERLLQQQFDEKKISQEDLQTAMTHNGPVWQNAVNEAQANDDSLKFDAWDFATTMTSPHAPLLWAYNVARGTPNEIGPFSPLSITTKNLATTLGVADWNNSNWNVEGRIRKGLGLPAFSQWDDYYVDRTLSDMVGTGEFSVGDIQTAMVVSSMVQQGKMTSAQAVQENPAYAEATKRANIEQSGGPVGTLMGIIGLKPNSYPEGERNLRMMQDEFTKAYTSYHEVNLQAQAFIDAHPELDKQTAQQQFFDAHPDLVTKAGSLTEFFDKHPEYETRLGLWDKPEVRIQKFMVDEVWSTWNALPTLYKNELKVQLGQDFNDQFLSSDTRNTANIPVERMAVWVKLMGGDPPGTLKASAAAFGKLAVASPDIAKRTQVFYDMRSQIAPNWYSLQNSYYDLPVGQQRKAFLAKNPSLKTYWNWRTDFMNRNPDVLPYLSDTPPAASQYRPAQQNPQFSWQEWKSILPSATQELVLQYYQQGLPLPSSVNQQLEILAQTYNVQGGGQALLQLIGQSLH
jgi:hypothetical protein